MSKNLPKSQLPGFIAVDQYEDKVLPVGIHPCSSDEFQRRLVDDFPTSGTRGLIFDGFSTLRKECQAHQIEVKHWVDGSFVTSKLNPGDVDVVHFVAANDLDKLSDAGKAFVEQVLDGGKETKGSHLTDSYLVPIFTRGAPGHDQMLALIEEWRDFWGHTRPYCPQPGMQPIQSPKGFLEMETRSAEHAKQGGSE